MDSSPDSPGPLQRAGILGELVLFVWMWNQAKALSPIGTGSGIQGRDLLVQAVVVVPPTFVLVWLFLRMRRAALADIGFRSPRPGWIRALFAGAVAGWLIQWLPIPFYWVFEAAGYQAPATPFSLGGSGDLAAGLLGASITGGFMEELVYRGYLLARLER
ncbi:MAG: hypothetical protein ACE5H3_03445, partial [Planctomycetota bacterium]